MSSSSDNRQARAYKMCTASMVRYLNARLLEEKDRGELSCNLNRRLDRLQHYSGISRGTLSHLLTANDIPQCGDVEQRNRNVAMTCEDEARIRPVIVRLVLQKKTPTLNLIMHELRNEEEGWEYGRTSLAEAMHRIGFKFNSKRHDYYDRLREDERNVLLRIEYCNRYEQFVAEGRPIVYLDESWINKNVAPKKGWHDGTKEVSAAVPSGKGPRWIVIGAGTRDGWVPNSFHMWKGNVQSEDYHTEMNGSVFKDWVHNFLLPNIAPNAVITCDRAPYHLILRQENMAAKQAARKDELINWLLQRGVTDGNGSAYTAAYLNTLRKSAIFAICAANKPPIRYQLFDWVDAWNASHGTDLRINLLPVAHPQLNPIELMWSWLKGYVARNNHDFDMAAIRTLTLTRVQELDGVWWSKACGKAHKFTMDCLQQADLEAPDEEDVPPGVIAAQTVHLHAEEPPQDEPDPETIADHDARQCYIM